MKRVALILVSFVFLFVLATTGTAQAAITGHDVTGRFVYSDDPNISVADTNGDGYEAYVDGVIIRVEVSDNTAFQNAGYSIVVHRITEKEPDAFAWFEACAGSIGIDRMYYEVYIIDTYGRRVVADVDLYIKLTLPESYSDPIAYSLNKNGEMASLSYQQNGGSIEFTVKSEDYIAVARKSVAVEPTPTLASSPVPITPGIPPKMGDMSLAVTAIFAVALGILTLWINKKKYD